MTDLTVGLRKQKHLCPLRECSLINNNSDLYIIYKDGNEKNRKAGNLAVIHRHCWENAHAILIEVSKMM